MMNFVVAMTDQTKIASVDAEAEETINAMIPPLTTTPQTQQSSPLLVQDGLCILLELSGWAPEAIRR